MGTEVIDFNGNRNLMEREIKLLEEQNVELRNSVALRRQELQNGLSGIMGAAFNQYNITSFGPLFQANIVQCISIQQVFLNYFYKTHRIIQTAIKQPVMDAFSAGDQTGVGVTIRSPEMDEEDVQRLHEFMEDEGIWEVLISAKTWARLFGGGAIIISDGAKDYRTPLDLDSPIRHLRLYAADRWELSAPQRLDVETDIVTTINPQQAAFANQEFYDFYGMRLHKSRVITLMGEEAPHIVRQQLQGWGMSEIESMIEDFNLYLKTRNVLFDLLNEAKVDVFKIEGLREAMGTPGGEQAIQRRMTTVQQVKNMNNALILDKLDDYDQKQLTFSGIPEIMKENRMGIASATRIPISKLFGVGASGFSSGEDDLETYNSMVQSTIRQPMRKPTRQVIDLCMRYLFGARFNYSIAFKPLRVMDSKDEENIKDQKFNRVTAGYDRGLVSSEQWGEEVKKENLISVETAAQQGLVDEFPESPIGSAKDMMDDEGEGKPKESKED